MIGNMTIDYSKKDINILCNKGLILVIGISSPMLIVSIYFIYKNSFLIVWDALPIGALLIFFWIVWIYIWKEKTKFKRNISKIRNAPSDFVYELFAYSGFTFIIAMAFSFVFPILSIILIAIGFWQIYYAKKVVDFKLLPVLQNKIKPNLIKGAD